MKTKATQPKMRYCFNCGAELGAYSDYDYFDACGESRCEAAAREAVREERQELMDEYHDRTP